jgi:transposase InsO family protein
VVKEFAIEIIDEYRKKLSLQQICKIFNIHPTTYYRWKNNQSKAVQHSPNEALVIAACKKHKFTYGYRKISAYINRNNPINKNTVQKIMQKYNLQCKVRVKKYKKYIGNESLVVENKLNRNFKATRPLEKLVTDITYLPFGNSMQYLSSIIDLYSGKIIAYTIANTQDISLVTNTLHQLPPLKKPCILHSDQGSVYTSYIFQELVKTKSITMSMSRKGTPADNAPIESFHSTLKSETFYLQPELLSSNEIVSHIVLQYIQNYNHFRIQKKLGYLSPIEFESRFS